MRVAQWSPDAPAIPVCFTTAGDTWDGQMPQLAQLVAGSDAGSLGDGGTVGLTFPQMHLVHDHPAGHLLGAPRGRGLGGLLDQRRGPRVRRQPLANTYTTVAAIGEKAPVQSDQPLKLVAFTDDVTAPAGQAAVRFINASPKPPLDRRRNRLPWAAREAFVPLFAGIINLGQTGSVAGPDAGDQSMTYGYLAIQRVLRPATPECACHEQPRRTRPPRRTT